MIATTNINKNESIYDKMKKKKKEIKTKINNITVVYDTLKLK